MSRLIVVIVCMDSSSNRGSLNRSHSRGSLVPVEEILVVGLGGPTMSARIGMMRALNRHSAKATPAPRRKPAKAYRVVR